MEAKRENVQVLGQGDEARCVVVFCGGTACRQQLAQLEDERSEITDFCIISSTYFPVSRTAEIRVFVKTSGETSRKTWWFAKSRNNRAAPESS